ncbi:MAG TPA: Coenzyme F420 hydrogenase/dehydrogenase, beta subunit C-terminal domain [Candidatus Desulfaltia sp.]|nr:Coenzyme F420 hydrogenase/dehydrogenase, beta subunit C-terminal domain [Candidatus Desulfaltia sp.]
MSTDKKSFKDLEKKVLDAGLCVACGTCVAACPVNVTELEAGKPRLVGNCIECGLCYRNCPRTDFDEAGMDQTLFGRSRDSKELLTGVYKSVFAAKTKSSAVQGKAQDGGVVTSLLIQFIEDGGDGVIVAGLEPDKVWVPRPVVARSSQEVIASAGTKYTVSPTLLGVKEAVKDQGLKKVAVVGTPCQIRGLSRLTQGQHRNKKFTDAVALKVGLFCMETFSYDDWVQYLKDEGVDPGKVTKFEIKSGRFYALAGEETLHRAKLGKVKKLIRPCCHVCEDFTSEYADVSVGNVGSPDGWSTVIVRTERGGKAFNAAVASGMVEAQPIEGFDLGETLVHRLAKMKKEKEGSDE